MLRNLLGEIVRGQRHATPWSELDPVLAEVVGVKLHPGTINVLVPDVTQEHRILHHGGGIEPQHVRHRGWHRFCPCTLDGRAAFIVCTWRGAIYPPETPIPGTTLFEIVAAQKLPNIEYWRKGVPLSYDPDHVQTGKL